MSAEEWTITYPTEPGDWHDNGRPFRCCYCNRMADSADGKWVVRTPYVGPGQFMAVHAKECRTGRKWRGWFR